MIEDWTSFLVTGVCGICAIVCAFEGVRRIATQRAGRNAVLMLVFGELFCAAWGGFAYWDHWTRNETLEQLQHTATVKDLPADFAKLPPDKREKLGISYARATYIERGNVIPYVELSGALKSFVPRQADIQQRESRVTRRAQLAHAARDSYEDAFQWWLWGLLAAILGYLVSLDKRPPGRKQGEAATGIEESPPQA
jgi:hypothetical protein